MAYDVFWHPEYPCERLEFAVVQYPTGLLSPEEREALFPRVDDMTSNGLAWVQGFNARRVRGNLTMNRRGIVKKTALPTNPKEGDGMKEARPHPSPLPRGEGGVVPAS
jgi:hypothetical protein